MLSFDPLHSDFAEMNGMNPFKSIAVPRPICWVSTVSEDGIDNLAPYSQFSQFPLYFESQGVTDDYARCHALDEDREKILAEFST